MICCLDNLIRSLPRAHGPTLRCFSFSSLLAGRGALPPVKSAAALGGWRNASKEERKICNTVHAKHLRAGGALRLADAYGGANSHARSQWGLATYDTVVNGLTA